MHTHIKTLNAITCTISSHILTPIQSLNLTVKELTQTCNLQIYIFAAVVALPWYAVSKTKLKWYEQTKLGNVPVLTAKFELYPMYSGQKIPKVKVCVTASLLNGLSLNITIFSHGKKIFYPKVRETKMKKKWEKKKKAERTKEWLVYLCCLWCYKQTPQWWCWLEWIL